MTARDPFAQARETLSRDRSRSAVTRRERGVLAQLGPDEANRYYVDGVSRSTSAIHVRALMALQTDVHVPCRLPFEVRLPRTWLTKVAATHSMALDAISASRSQIARPDVAAWFGEDPSPCDHGIGCALYQQHISSVRRNGYGPRVVHELVDAATSALDPADENLLYRYARSIAVGAGRTGDRTSAVYAERLAMRWFTDETVFSLERRPDRANLLRSVAFARLISSGRADALSTVRAAAQEMNDIRSLTADDDRALSFRIEEATFPTLETLSLCEGLWGDPSESTRSAQELVHRFPVDSRAWIRLAKSLFAAGEAGAAVAALLKGAEREHPKWLFCVTAARIIVEGSGISLTTLDSFMSRYDITLEQLETV